MGHLSRPLALLLLAGAAAARAGEPALLGKNEVSDELGVAASPPTPTSPRSVQTTNILDAVLDLGHGLGLNLTLGTSVVKPAQSAGEREFATQGATIWTLGAGLTWEANDHVTVEAAGHFSPPAELLLGSTVDYTTQVGVNTVTVPLDALLYSRSSSAGGSLAASYDTAGDSDLEAAVDLGAAVEHFSSEQQIRALRNPKTGAVITPAELLDSCRRFPNRCPTPLLAALRSRPAALSQFLLQAALTGTLWRDTDLGLSATGYFYDRDPTEVGYFSLAAAGESAGGGGGIATAPLRWSVRPSVTQRLGSWTLRLALQHGVYVSGEGKLDALTAKVQYRFTRAFRMWLAAIGQRDEEFGTVNVLRGISLGALYRW